MQMRRFRGRRTVRSLRLCSRAPWTTSSSAAMRECSVSVERVFVQVRETCPDRAPAVLGDRCRHACPDRVLADVVDDGGQVGVAVEDACGEAIAEEVAGADVTLVEALCVEAVEAAEAVRQLPARARKDE